jgi:two-component system chemotaxis response regulator CheB
VDRDLIVIGGSDGSLSVLQQILCGLDRNLPAALMIVTHQSQTQRGRLPKILDRCGPLPVGHAKDGEPIELGRVYVAPPDFHLLVERGRVRVSRGPKENRLSFETPQRARAALR